MFRGIRNHKWFLIPLNQLIYTFLCSKAYYFLKITLKCHEHRTEAVAAVGIAIAVAEIEKTGKRRITVNAPADEERTSRAREVRVVAVPRAIISLIII